MKFSEQVKPVSYLKSNAAKAIRTLAETGAPLVITQHGKAVAVVQDVFSYEETQETLALLKMLVLGNHQFEQGKAIPAKEAFRRVRARFARR